MQDYLSWSEKQFRQIALPRKHVYIWLKAGEISKDLTQSAKLSRNWTVTRKASRKTLHGRIGAKESVQSGKFQFVKWVTDNTSVMMNSWVEHRNDGGRRLKLTWWLLTLWPMMLLSTISITHCDRAQISIQHGEWTSHLFCFYLHSLAHIWTH